MGEGVLLEREYYIWEREDYERGKTMWPIVNLPVLQAFLLM